MTTMTMRKGTRLHAVANELVTYGDAWNMPSISQRVSDLRKMGFTIRSSKERNGVYTMSKTARKTLARALKNAV